MARMTTSPPQEFQQAHSLSCGSLEETQLIWENHLKSGNFGLTTTATSNFYWMIKN